MLINNINEKYAKQLQINLAAIDPKDYGAMPAELVSKNARDTSLEIEQKRQQNSARTIALCGKKYILKQQQQRLEQQHQALDDREKNIIQS